MINRGWHNGPIGGRSAEWNQLNSTLYYSNLKKFNGLKTKPTPKVKKTMPHSTKYYHGHLFHFKSIQVEN
jgi:hypothetical protein